MPGDQFDPLVYPRNPVAYSQEVLGEDLCNVNITPKPHCPGVSILKKYELGAAKL
jgi:hypothetical protein